MLHALLLSLTAGAANLLTMKSAVQQRKEAYESGYSQGYIDAERRYSAALSRLNADFAVDALSSSNTDMCLAQRAATAYAIDQYWAPRYVARLCLLRAAQTCYSVTQRELDASWLRRDLGVNVAKQIAERASTKVTERHVAICVASYDLQAGTPETAFQYAITADERTGLSDFAINARHFRYTNVRAMLRSDFHSMCDSDVRRLENRYDRYVHDALLAAIPNGATALIDLQTNACTFVNLGYSIADFVDQQDGFSKMSANAVYINRGIWATRMGYSCCDDVNGSAITNLLVEHGCLRPTEDRIRTKPLEFPRWFEADGIDQLFSYRYSAISSNSPLADVTKRCAGDSDALARLARLGQLCEAIAVYRDGDIITVYFVVRTCGAPTVFAPLVHGMTIQGANFFTGARVADTSMESFCDGAHQPKLNERPIWYGNIVERGTQSAPSSRAGRAGLSVEICSHNPSNEWPTVCHKRASKILNLDTKLGIFDACIDAPRVKLDTKLAQTCHHYVSEASSVIIARTASDQDNADLSSFLLPENRIYAITPDNRYLIPPKNETTKVNVRGKIIR